MNGGRPQMHFGQPPYGAPQNFQYPHMQQPYMGLLSQQTSMAQTPASQPPYSANLAMQRPNLYSQAGQVGQAGGVAGTLPGGGTPGSWQPQQVGFQVFASMNCLLSKG